MTDPKYAVGDRVRFQGQLAVVQYVYFSNEPPPYHLIGYQLIFDNGKFSGWHAEDLLTKEEAE